MSERPPHVLAADMLEAVERILAYTSGMTYDAFCADTEPWRQSGAHLHHLPRPPVP